MVATTLALPGLREFLGLAPTTPPGLLIAGGASLLAAVLGRALPVERWLSPLTNPGQRAELGAAIAHA